MNTIECSGKVETAQPLCVTVQEAQRLLGLSITTLYKLMRQDALHTTIIAGRRMVLTSSIYNLVKDGTLNAAIVSVERGGWGGRRPGAGRKAKASMTPQNVEAHHG